MIKKVKIKHIIKITTNQFKYKGHKAIIIFADIVSNNELIWITTTNVKFKENQIVTIKYTPDANKPEYIHYVKEVRNG